MKKTRHLIKRKIQGVRRELVRIRAERPALFAALVMLAFSFGGLVVWGGATITLSINSASTESSLALHYTFDSEGVSNEERYIQVEEYDEFMGSTTVPSPVGDGPSNHGPYVAHGLQWIFFSNGSGGFVYKTKSITGGEWSEPSSSYSSYIGQGRYFNITFDGAHFHIAYRINARLYYRRFTPNADGTVTAGDALSIYDGGTWDVSYQPFYITTDSQGRPWIQFQVTNGTSYKPVVMASTATDGTWSTRSGFPYDVQSSVVDEDHGDYPNIVELGEDNMLFVFVDETANRISARVWDDGVWGPVEDTGLGQATYGRMSAISPAPGEVMVNQYTTVRHRATNGTWSDRSPGGMDTASDNSFSKANGVVRLWDSDGDDLRYKETSDAGQNWGPLTTFATSTGLSTFSSSSEVDAGYHPIVWSTGSNPYVRFAGVDGQFMIGSKLGEISDRSGNANHGTVEGDVIAEAGRVGQAALFNGENGYISAGNIGTNIRSVSFWLKPNLLGGGVIAFNGSQSININSGTGINWYGSDGWYDNSWSYRKPITIQSSQVEETLTNFPVLIQRTDTDWRSTSNGGNVAQTNGNDILFTSSSGAKLDHEIEYYNPTTGELIAWVEVPTVSSTANTTLYMYYGNSGAADQQNVSGVWSNGFQAVYHMSEQSGSTLFDSTSNNNDATKLSATDPTATTSGFIDNAQDFDGTNDNAEAPHDTSLVLTNAMTLSGWINPDALGQSSTSVIIGKDYNGGKQDYAISYMPDGAIRFRRVYDALENTWDLDTTNTVSINDWTYVTGVFDGSQMRVYIDGSQDPTVLNATQNIYNSGRPLVLGSAYGASATNRRFDGTLDELRISSVARSAGWIETEYNNQSSPSTFYGVGTEQSPDNSWSYRKPITIQSSEVEETLTNFPVLIQRTDTDWRSTSNGGNVAQTNGNDILFTSSSGAKLDHEIEYYNPTTGELIAWVEVPTVSSTANTTLYMYYGNSGAADQQNATGVWDSSYAGVWHMREDPSGTAPQMLDSTANSNDGTSNGSMTSGDQVTGQIDGSLDFDDVDDVIRVPNSTSTNITGDEFTLSAWVYPRNMGCGSSDCDDGIISKAHESASNSERYHLGIENDGYISVRRYSGSQIFGGSANAPVVNNQWQYIVGRYDGSTLKAYYNGNEVGSTAATGNITSSTEDLIFGKRYGTTRFSNGRIDEVRVSNIARSAGWIETEYNNQSSPSTFYGVGVEEPYDTADIIVSGLTDPVTYINGSSSITTLTPNAWNHITVTTSTNINASAVEIGRVGGSYYDGAIDDIRIYSATLSSADIDRIYHLGATTTINTTLSPPELQVGLAGHWPFDGLSANVQTTPFSDGSAWTEETAGAGWSERTRAQGTLVYNNLLWIMGGWNGTSGLGDVWYSADGASWTLATNSPAWGTKATHETLVYDDKMWVIGGGDKSVYYSTDGVSWTQATSSAAWPGTFRNQHAVVVYDDKMWMMGGTNGSNQNDVWYSTDGATWTQATSSAGWSARQNHRAVVYDDKMWVVGGGLDVWWSTNGSSWTRATSNAGWGGSTRFRHGLVVYDDKMWVLGGNNGSGPTSDVWYSTNGSSWTQATSSVAWGPREEHGFAVFNDRMWILGGMNSSGNHNDVWSSDINALTSAAGTISDWSGNNNHGTYVSGETAGGASTGRTGQGLKFSGTSGNIATIPDDDSLDIGSGSFTYGAWIKSDSFVGDYDMPMYKGGASAGDTGWDMELGADGWGAGISDGSMVRIVFFNDNSWSPPYLETGEWYHLMAVVDRSNDEFRSYRNGALINTTSITGFGTSNSTYDLTLGGRPGGDPNLFNGVIDDMRVYNRALSADEINRLYHLGATTKVNTTLSAEGSADGPIAHWTFDGPTISGTTVGDAAGTSNGTIYGATPVPGKIGQGLVFDGSDDYLEMPNSSALRDTPNNEWAMSAWVYPTETGGNSRGIVRKSTGGDGYFMRMTSGSGFQSLLRFSTGYVERIGGTIALNEWTHVVMTYDGTTRKHYLNGEEVGSWNEGGTLVFDANVVRIGANTSSTELFNGIIDEVRLYNRTLSVEEVQRLYQLGN